MSLDCAFRSGYGCFRLAFCSFRIVVIDLWINAVLVPEIPTRLRDPGLIRHKFGSAQHKS